MIKIFTGDDRVRAKNAIVSYFGTEDYEILDGADLEKRDLPTIFRGITLFSTKRTILIRDFLANKSLGGELVEYLDSPHTIALFETKLDKRSAVYKDLKNRLEILEFNLPQPNFNQVFDIYRTAKRSGAAALKVLAAIKETEDPIKFTGLLVSQALKDYSAHPGLTEKRILRALSEADLQMKTTGTDPWLIVEGFLLRLSPF